MNGIQQAVTHIALGFALKELAEYGAETNWAEVENGVDQHLAGIFHDGFIDKVAEAIVNPLLTAIGKACANVDDLETLLSDLESGDTTAALTALVNIVRKVAPPEIAVLLPAAA